MHNRYYRPDRARQNIFQTVRDVSAAATVPGQFGYVGFDDKGCLISEEERLRVKLWRRKHLSAGKDDVVENKHRSMRCITDNLGD